MFIRHNGYYVMLLTAPIAILTLWKNKFRILHGQTLYQEGGTRCFIILKERLLVRIIKEFLVK